MEFYEDFIEMPDKCRKLPIIDLMNLWQASLIIKFPSGVVYKNQTGNTSCGQRGEEGVLVPLIDIFLDIKECPLYTALANLEWWPIRGLSKEQADKIDTILQQFYFTKCLKVDRNKLSESEEAWVYVSIDISKLEIVYNFNSREGILVWSNSD